MIWLGMTVLCPHSLHAGGLQALPVHARGSALGSATVALSFETGEFSRNPALLVSSEGTRLTLGAGLIIPEFRFSGIHPSESETKAEPVFLFPPSFALSFKLNDEVGVGISAGAPFLTRSDWNSRWVGRQLSTSFEHQTGTLVPAIAYSPVTGISLGVAIPLRLTKHVMTSWLFETGGELTAPGGAYQRTIEGQSGVEAGLQAGIILAGEDWSLGGSYTFGMDVALPDAEASLSTSLEQPGREVYSGREASIALSLPAELAVGAALRPLPSFLLTTELDLVMWSVAEQIEYQIPGTQDGYVIPQRWDNSYRFAVGLEYGMTDVDIRAGFSFDYSPVPDATAHPAFPDADRYGYSVGLGYRIGPGLVLDLAASAFAFGDRTVENSELTVIDEETGTQGLPFNGTYRTAMTSIALSVSYFWR